jgi:hypothetical protein
MDDSDLGGKDLLLDKSVIHRAGESPTDLSSCVSRFRATK